MLEIHCKRCANLGDDECRKYGKDPDKATKACADDGFKNYIVLDQKENGAGVIPEITFEGKGVVSGQRVKGYLFRMWRRVPFIKGFFIMHTEETTETQHKLAYDEVVPETIRIFINGDLFVQCKDCIHWRKDAAGCTDFVGYCGLAGYMIGANGHCSYGSVYDKEKEE